jgi:ribosomal protein S6
LKRYEGMFLFDSAAARDWASIEAEIRRLMERIGAELLVCVKFDERKLAFEIKRRKRGLYVLTYFDAPATKIADLERDASLSEMILRTLVLRAENLTEQKLAELRAHPAEQPLQTMSGDGRRHEDEGGGRGREGGYRDREGGYRDRDRDREGGFGRDREGGFGRDREGGFGGREGGFEGGERGRRREGGEEAAVDALSADVQG